MSNVTAPSAIALPDDREYMTPAEFADLPSDVHHAVWAAFSANAIGICQTRWDIRLFA